MSGLRNLGTLVRILVMAYILGGLAYWATSELFIRYIGKEIVFSPLISILLAVPFWPMHVYGDLKWIGIMPQDVAAFLAVLFSIPLLLRKHSM